MLRRLIRLISPAWLAKIEAESRDWMLRCPTCNGEVSVWDAGGLRYKAAGRARRYGRCPACRQKGMLELYKRERTG